MPSATDFGSGCGRSINHSQHVHLHKRQLAELTQSDELVNSCLPLGHIRQTLSQVCGNHVARVQAICLNTLALLVESCCQTVGEQHIGCLAHSVSLPLIILTTCAWRVVDLRKGLERRSGNEGMAFRGDIDNSGFAARREEREQQVGEQEMSDMVASKLQLHVLSLRCRPVSGKSHDRGVVDQDVQMWDQSQDLCRSSTN
jgi:hypothetical protein